MTYHSLLLDHDGGIFPSQDQIHPHADRATVAIGLGGIGIAALAELKRKVYQQFIPDNPGTSVPRYDHIQFLAIDSDEAVMDGIHGKAQLDRLSEFFSIDIPNLKNTLAGNAIVKNNPVFHWMDVDAIAGLLPHMGTGGIRQVGRYLLLSRAAALKAKIEETCIRALHGLFSLSLDIYIFAGISGGTGGGGFLDLCYIVRKVLQDHGLETFSRITGLFFLPDVITNKPEVFFNPLCVAYNRANGYAALKDLDYHMRLKESDDFFAQNYGSFSIHTQNTPVDLCCLVSGTRLDGTLLNDGCAIQTASGYVLDCLAGISPHFPPGHPGYCILGAATAEVPTAQIATYLAAGFYRSFQRFIGRDKAVITEPIVDDWVQRLGLTAKQVYNELVRGCDALFLPEIGRYDLAAYGATPKGKVPQPWADSGNNWIDRCSGKRTQNRAALNTGLNTFDFDRVPAGSLTGRVFLKLCELSMDPNYGPYYAANLLCGGGYDLMAALDGAIRQAEEERAVQEFQLHGNGSGSYDEYAMQCSSDFCQKPNRKNYERYVDAIQQWYLIYNRYNECDDLVTTLRALKSDLSKLYRSYFVPLITLLDNLNETFIADSRYLDSPAAAAPAAYTWRILELEDVRPKLDEVIENLAGNEAVNKFMDYLLKGYDQWQTGDDGKIGRYVSRYMETVFDQQISRSLEDYLFDVFPQAGGKIDLLAQEIKSRIIQRIHDSALPMFWCSPTFDPLPFQTGSILVPVGDALYCAVSSFWPVFSLYYNGWKNQIHFLRLIDGVPLSAYAGMDALKAAYDNMRATPAGAGLHLYGHTD